MQVTLKSIYLGCLTSTALGLAGCDDFPKARTEAEIEDIASDAAADATSEQFSALESKIGELESEVESLKGDNDSLRSDLDSLERKHSELEDVYNQHRHPTY